MKQVAIRTCFLGLSAPTFGQIPEASTGKWVPTWIAMPQEVEWWNLPAAPYIALFTLFADSTIRQTVHTSLGTSSHIRIQISNVFGPTDLPITAVTVGLPANGAAGVSALEPGNVHQVTFSGRDQVNASELVQATKIEHWYFLSAVEAWTVWEALQIKTRAGQNLVLSHMQNSSNPTLQSVAVINQAAVGNRVLADIQGPSALSRIERDVLSYPSVRYVIVFEGINDIGVAGTDPESQSFLYE
ncbi:extracellular gdsl-like lipase [Moniliophthora roreri MCA 2997]|uniref:Extracellular gdsl-like lipase n=1 Tax=Moniliophthora roreri (strain MCA 2997) TaxID=1381753 RepID=V2X662_MONRO|nr:extracellular gdsl-like lipase [Moniliophthora roreri MCA 2997]